MDATLLLRRDRRGAVGPWAAALCVGGLIAGCGSELLTAAAPGAPAVDAGDVTRADPGDAQPADTAVDAPRPDPGVLFGGADDAAAPADDADAPSTEDTVAPTCETAPGSLGCPCAEPEDCDSGLCVAADLRRVCVQPCVDDCPRGTACVAVGGASDTTFLCLPRFTRLCQPCRRHVDCQPAGVTTPALCLDYGEAGRYCGASCEEPADCPGGYACEALLLDGQREVRQCVRSVGPGPLDADAASPCACNEAGRLLGMSTTCAQTNAIGRCEGERRCTEGGLTACDAPAASEEVCDFADNDCNGLADDLADDGSCLVENPFGRCPGRPACVGGVRRCVGGDADPERCDRVDNDCDGETDEGFDDTDGDGLADCVDTDADGDNVPDTADVCPGDYDPGQEDTDGDGVGDACDADADGDGFPTGRDCAPLDPTAHPGALELCNGRDDDCDGVIDGPDATCDDGVACTVDACDAASGTCRHAPDPLRCADGNPCTEDRCDPATGCVNADRPGAPCDDGVACTADDACRDGRCQGVGLTACCADDADCDDANPCTADRCDGATGACHHDPAAREGAACDADGDACTEGDQCAGGICRPGAPFDCGPSDAACLRRVCRSLGPDRARCITEAVERGRACDDGGPCTVNDRCDGQGRCEAGSRDPRCCAAHADCDDGDDCTLDRCLLARGECAHPAAPDGRVCDADGDGCTAGDACEAGACVAGEPVACGSSDMPCRALRCVSTSAESFSCVARPVAVGTTCSDGNPCTTGEACDGAGQCVPASFLDGCCGEHADCDDGNPCTANWCDAATGACRRAPMEDGGACDDGDPCTVGDACAAGVCQAGAPLDCGDHGDQCFTFSCVAFGPQAAECTAVPLPVGSVCSDGDPCSAGDHCDGAGACVSDAIRPFCCTGDAGCDDGNPCTVDACDPVTGRCTHRLAGDGVPCDADGDGCTVGDRCVGSRCVAGGPADCGITGETCRVLTCRSTSRTGFACVDVAAPAGSACDDFNACTVGDRCTALGTCAPGELQDGCCRADADCLEGNPCTVDRCDAATGACSHELVADGAGCDDGDPCTGDGRCRAGRCEGPPEDCDDGDPCTVGRCTGVGCAQLPAADGSPCDDGDPCTTTDLCQSGQCVGAGAPGHCEGGVCTCGGGGVDGPFAQIAAAHFGQHACGVTTDGLLACWGRNDFGQLGDGTRSGRREARLIDLDVRVAEVRAGTDHTCARATDGRVACWGRGDDGRLGDGTQQTRATPALVLDIDSAVSIGVGEFHACAVLESGAIRCWGRGQSGALGNGNPFTNHSRPVAVSNMSSGRLVRGGQRFTCAEVGDESMRCWGRGVHCQLSWTEVLCGNQFTPVTVVTGSSRLVNVRDLDTGAFHACAVQNDGDIWCWGENDDGRLGLGHTQQVRTAREVPGIEDAVAVCAGGDFSCAVRAGGGVLCWGANDHGQLGAAGVGRTAPTTVVGVTDRVAITCGADFACALGADGDVRCWGADDHGQLGDGP